jgi:hypothetical protein
VTLNERSLRRVAGAIHSDAGAVDYMRNLLRHERYTGYTSFGFGLPPATVIRSKVRASTRSVWRAFQQGG